MPPPLPPTGWVGRVAHNTPPLQEGGEWGGKKEKANATNNSPPEMAGPSGGEVEWEVWGGGGRGLIQNSVQNGGATHTNQNQAVGPVAERSPDGPGDLMSHFHRTAYVKHLLRVNELQLPGRGGEEGKKGG
eukprot:Sspe_Gene.79445::Locus_49829_Transcript_1_1_Confidence_1.000_Length_829::g.79445::m.79445